MQIIARFATFCGKGTKKIGKTFDIAEKVAIFAPQYHKIRSCTSGVDWI